MNIAQISDLITKVLSVTRKIPQARRAPSYVLGALGAAYALAVQFDPSLVTSIISGIDPKVVSVASLIFSLLLHLVSRGNSGIALVQDFENGKTEAALAESNLARPISDLAEAVAPVADAIAAAVPAVAPVANEVAAVAQEVTSSVATLETQTAQNPAPNASA